MKKTYLELLRILSAFFVVASHTNSFVYKGVPTDSIEWIFMIGYQIMSKTAVPIFFMISGGLLLSKNYSYKDISKKIFKRLLLPLFFCSLIIYFKRSPVVSLENINNFINDFLGANILGNYWFMYTLIGLYLCVPFLSKMCKNFTNKDYKNFIILSFVFIFGISILDRYDLLNLSHLVDIPLISRYVAYFIIGNYLINHEKNNIENKKIICFMLTSLLLGIFMTYIDFNILNKTDYYYCGFSSVILFILSMLIIKLFKNCFSEEKKLNKMKNIIYFVSSTTFGIYMIHGVLIDHFKFIYNFCSQIGIHFIISLFIYQIVFFILLCLLVGLLKKIPLIKNII